MARLSLGIIRMGKCCSRKIKKPDKCCSCSNHPRSFDRGDPPQTFNHTDPPHSFDRSVQLDNSKTDKGRRHHRLNDYPHALVKVGMPAPEWTSTAVLSGGGFKEISLEDYEGKYLVFLFYPMDFTMVSPTEIIAFSDALESFQAVGCEIVAVSTDTHLCHFAWTNQPKSMGGLGPVKIPLLSDKNCKIAKDYGVYTECEGTSLRALFIIDDKQILRQITINDLQVGRSVEETLRLVQAFQFSDVHGEVCGADWKPWQKGLKAGISKSKAAFLGDG